MTTSAAELHDGLRPSGAVQAFYCDEAPLMLLRITFILDYPSRKDEAKAHCFILIA